jgi:hypothetical protein
VATLLAIKNCWAGYCHIFDMGRQGLAKAAITKIYSIKSVFYKLFWILKVWHEACLSGLQTYVVWVSVG